jgi:hypothetical protein
MVWMYDVEMYLGLGLLAIAGIFSTCGPLVAVIVHAMGNTVNKMFPDPTANLFYWIVLGLTVLLVVVIYGPQSLFANVDIVARLISPCRYGWKEGEK